jgi:hypothetical protein
VVAVDVVLLDLGLGRVARPGLAGAADTIGAGY